MCDVFACDILHMDMNVRVCICGSQRLISGVFLNHFLPYALRQNLSLENKAFTFSATKLSQANQLVPGDTIFASKALGLKQGYHAHEAFTLALRIPTLVQQALYPLIHLPILSYYKYRWHIVY